MNKLLSTNDQILPCAEVPTSIPCTPNHSFVSGKTAPLLSVSPVAQRRGWAPRLCRKPELVVVQRRHVNSQQQGEALQTTGDSGVNSHRHLLRSTPFEPNPKVDGRERAAARLPAHGHNSQRRKAQRHLPVPSEPCEDGDTRACMHTGIRAHLFPKDLLSRVSGSFPCCVSRILRESVGWKEKNDGNDV